MLNWRCYIVALGGAFAGATTVQGQEEALTVPSQTPVHLQEWLIEDKPDGLFTYARFRFVMPSLQDGVGFDAIEADFAALCDGFALDQIAAYGAAVDRVVISLAGRETEFGQTDPEVPQFFEVYRVENGRCIWEGF